jgi:hypothetical protein
MITIYKYSMMKPKCHFSMPLGAKIFCVQLQREIPQIWALVNTDQKMEIRTINLYGTGHELPPNPGIYIGTIQMSEGSLVLHVFEEAQ